MNSSPQDIPSIPRSGFVHPDPGFTLRFHGASHERSRRYRQWLGSGQLVVDLQTATEAAGLSVRRLPLPGQQARTFAHPAEAMLGNLLTFFRVRWVYEPTSFVLKRTASGAVAESFTPDFYLPDHQVYLELTTMRQPLVTRKNGKIRRLRELYPAVQIKTLYRRDYDRIIQTSELASPASVGDSDAIVFDSTQILTRATELATEIAQSIALAAPMPRPLVLTSIRAEAEPFQVLLARELEALGVDVELDQMELSLFKLGSIHRRISLLRRPSLSAQGRAVLLVAGATSTGLSLEYALKHLRHQHPIWLETVSLLDRDAARVVDAVVRFRGFEAPPELLSGFGLSRCDSGDDPCAIVKAAMGASSPAGIVEI